MFNMEWNNNQAIPKDKQSLNQGFMNKAQEIDELIGHMENVMIDTDFDTFQKRSRMHITIIYFDKPEFLKHLVKNWKVALSQPSLSQQTLSDQEG